MKSDKTSPHIPSVTIREIHNEDIKSLARVHVDCWWETYRNIISESYLQNLKYTDRQEMWEKLIPRRPEDGGTLVVFSEEENDVVGFCDFGKAREHEHGFGGEVYALYLLRRYQGNGIGRKLLERVKEEFKKRRVDSFYLWVLKDNPTKGFYEKVGGKFLKSQPLEMDECEHIEELFYWDL